MSVHTEPSGIPHSAAALGGASAGFFARMLTAPLDVVKIRMQLDNAVKIRPGFIANTVRAIYREEGLKTFYRGNVPALILWIGYGVFQFTVVNTLKPVFLEHLPAEDLASFCAGGTAALSATLITHPFDVLRTRFAGQGIPKVYTTMWGMVVGSGLRGMYAGLSPSLLNVVPSMGFSFAFYGLISRSIMKFDMNVGMTSLISGGGAGFLTKALLYPLDITKKRLQMQGLARVEVTRCGETVQYKGLIDCLRKIVKYEGITSGLYKGFVPTTIKAIVSTSAVFVAYEHVSQWAISTQIPEIQLWK
jgi:solute carrier family 25 thiamine pyrophosphate transporter 19